MLYAGKFVSETENMKMTVFDLYYIGRISVERSYREENCFLWFWCVCVCVCSLDLLRILLRRRYYNENLFDIYS